MKVISVNIHAVRTRIHKDMTHGCLDQAITLTHLVDKLQLLRWRTDGTSSKDKLFKSKSGLTRKNHVSPLFYRRWQAERLP